MKRTLALLIILQVAACGNREQQTTAAGASPNPPGVAGDPARGKKLVVDYGCLTCHVIPGVDGPRGRLGPSLAGMGSRSTVNGRFPNTPENMARYLQDPKAMDPDSTMPKLGITEEEARDIAALLATLK